jgi:hypothetical protein
LAIIILCLPAFSVKHKKGKKENKIDESTGLQKARFQGGRRPGQARTITEKQAGNAVTGRRTVLLHQLEQKGSSSQIVRFLDRVLAAAKKRRILTFFSVRKPTFLSVRIVGYRG